jgi:hypothetical protein
MMQLPDIIDIHWTTSKQPVDMEPSNSFGYVFTKELNWECVRHWPFYNSQSWHEYVKCTAEEHDSGITSVWVNNELVWHYSQDWIVDHATFVPKALT